MERGTHFDGKYTYDSRDLWVLSSTGSDALCNAVFEGLTHRASTQKDKHSEELALQRVSTPVVDLLKNIPVLVKTDIPELYKPWACSSESIGTPLFIMISRKGVVFLTDDNIPGLFYYRQTPIQ